VIFFLFGYPKQFSFIFNGHYLAQVLSLALLIYLGFRIVCSNHLIMWEKLKLIFKQKELCVVLTYILFFLFCWLLLHDHIILDL
jgi:hypothetical protein